MARHVLKAVLTNAEKRRLPSKHYVYVIDVEWSDGSKVTIYRRYSVFFSLHTKLLDKFPQFAGDKTGQGRKIPFLPGKKLFGRSSTHYVAEARAPLLAEYVTKLLESPKELAQSAEVKNFFEPQETDINPETESKEDKAKGSGGQVQVGDVLLLDQYRVIADYKKQNRQELSIKEDQIVEVIEKNENGWWFVQSDEGGERGFVPGTFLESLEGEDDDDKPPPVAAGGEEYIATKAFKATQPDEVTFDKNAVVKVTQKNLDGWWVIEYQGKKGQAPGSYLKKYTRKISDGILNKNNPANQSNEFADAATKLREAKTSNGTIDPPIRRQSVPKRPEPAKKGKKKPAAKRPVTEYVTMEPFEKTDASGVSFPAGASVTVLEKAETGWWYITFDGTEGWAPADFLEPKTTTDFLEPPSKEQERKSLPKPLNIPLRPVLPKSTENPKPKPAPGRPEGPKKPAAAGGALKPPKVPGRPSLAKKQEERPESGTSFLREARLDSVSDGKPAFNRQKEVQPAANFGSIAARAAALSGKGAFGGSAPSGEKPPIVLPGGPKRPPAVPKPPASGAKPKAAPAKPKPPMAGAKPKPVVPGPAKKPLVPVKPKPPVASKNPAAGGGGSGTHKIVDSFSANSDVELSVTKGETVTFVESNGDWSFVKNNKGGEGWIPGDLLEALTKSAAGGGAGAGGGGPSYKVLEAYTATSSDQLTLQQGQMLTLVESSDTGWWWMKDASGSEGWVPQDFVAPA